MASTWTLADLAALDAAIASGVSVVKHGDKTVQYHSLADMLRTRTLIARALASPKRPTCTYAAHSRGDA